MILAETGLHELPSTDFPQIKIVLSDHEAAEKLGEELPVGDEFRATWAQGRPYSSPQVCGFNPEFRFHPF